MSWPEAIDIYSQGGKKIILIMNYKPVCTFIVKVGNCLQIAKK